MPKNTWECESVVVLRDKANAGRICKRSSLPPTGDISTLVVLDICRIYLSVCVRSSEAARESEAAHPQ